MSADVKKIAEENKENRVARVFVSSTFLDMKEERDHLGEVVFPRIKAYCKQRGVEFVPIDLRWGITEKQAENGKTLEICLKGIDRSRPFFICLLGERYGSLISSLKGELDKNFLTDYPNVKGYKTEDIGVTEAEIRHGVLDLDGEVDAHFWFRSPASSGSCDPRLTALKERIRKDPRNYPVDEYVKLEDSQEDKTEWLQKLGEQIESALTAWIDKTWAEARELNWLEKQNLDQSAFERSRGRLYVPNPGDYDALDAFAGGSDSRVLAVTGSSGLGKSSLLINWANHYRQKNSKALVLTHYISASEGSDQPENILRRLTETLDPTNGDGNELSGLLSQFNQGKSLDDWKKEFVIAVNNRLSKDPETSLVLIIDGLNQLSEYDDAKNLAWLPEHAKTKIIISTVDSDEKTVGAIKRREWKTYKAQPLSVKQIEKIIEKTLDYRGRSLSPERVQKIVKSPIASNPLALYVLLDELCCFTDFQTCSDSKETQLDLAIANYTDSALIEDLLTKIFDRVEKSLEWLNETSNEGDVVPLLASLIAVSRYGLTDDELSNLSGYNQLAVSTFLSVFDAHLVDRSGRYTYSHGYIRTAIEERYASRLTRSREILAGSFQEKEEFKRRCQEVPWQLKELGEWNRLYEFVLDFDVFDELYDGELTSDFCLYWNELLRPENGGFKFDGYLELDDSYYDDKKKADLWHKLGHITSTYDTRELPEKAYNKAIGLYRDLAKKKPEIYNSNIAVTLNNLGILHCDMGLYSESESEHKESLMIYRDLATKYPDSYNSDVAWTLNNLGILHKTMGLYWESESEFKEGLSTRRTLAAKNPDVYNPDIAATLNNLGNLHSDMESYSASESEYKESLMIYRALAIKNPDVYNSYVATTLNNLGALHRDKKLYSASESEYKESLMIYRALAIKNPEVYNSDVAETLNNLGTLHQARESYLESESEYKESLAIFRTLATRHSGVYNSYVARTLNNLGTLHSDMGFYSESEIEHKESLMIFRALMAKNPDVYNSDVAMTLNNLGTLHQTRESYSESESEYKESLMIYRDLMAKNPDVYNSDVAMTLNNLGTLHSDMSLYSVSESEYKESLAIRRTLAAKNPDVYNSDVVATLFKLALLYLQTERYDLAKEKLLEYLELYERLSEAVRRSKAKQFESVQTVLTLVREIEEGQ